MRKPGRLESRGTPTHTGEGEADEIGYSKVAGPSEEQEDGEEGILRASITTRGLYQREPNRE